MILVVALIAMAVILTGYKIVRALTSGASDIVPPRVREIVKAMRPWASTPSMSRAGKYEFHLCLVGDRHRWIKTRNDAMAFNHTEGETEYSIETKDLYEIEPGAMTRLKWRLKGIKSGFIVVFDKKNEPIGYQAPSKSAYLLKTVEESRALSKALRDEFKKAIEGKTLFMYVILIVVAIVAYLVITGQLSVGL